MTCPPDLNDADCRKRLSTRMQGRGISAVVVGIVDIPPRRKGVFFNEAFFYTRRGRGEMEKTLHSSSRGCGSNPDWSSNFVPDLSFLCLRVLGIVVSYPRNQRDEKNEFPCETAYAR